MSLSTRIRYGLARALLGAKASDLAFVPNWVRESWLTPSFDRLTREGYAANAAVFACISALQFAFPEAPMVVQDSAGEPQPRHPLQALIRRPNPIMSEAELALYVITYLAIGGNCYLYKVRVGGRVRELWPYHAGQIMPIPGGADWIAGYKYDVGDGKDRVIDAADIIHLKWPSIDPQQPWMALPPLRSVAREIDTDTEATRYLYALLANDASPRTIVTVPTSMSDPAFERFRQQFQQRHGGPNRGNVAVVEGAASINRISLNLQELAFDAIRRVPETRIAAAFRVPAIVAGLNAGLERATYANFGEARRMFVEQTLVPLWRQVADEIEQDLGDEFGGGVTVAHDLSKVAALQENENDRYTRAINVWKEGVATRNEARRMLGLPDVEALVLAPGAEPLPPGDVFKTNAAPAAPPMIDVTPEQQQMPMLTDQQKARARGAIELKAASTEAIERRLEQRLTDYLLDQYERAAAGIEKAA